MIKQSQRKKKKKQEKNIKMRKGLVKKCRSRLRKIRKIWKIIETISSRI